VTYDHYQGIWHFPSGKRFHQSKIAEKNASTDQSLPYHWL